MTREDAAYLDYLSSEQSERERIEHFNTATECDGCPNKLGDERYEDGEFVVCRECVVKCIKTFSTEVLAVARAESRWG